MRAKHYNALRNVIPNEIDECVIVLKGSNVFKIRVATD